MVCCKYVQHILTHKHTSTDTQNDEASGDGIGVMGLSLRLAGPFVREGSEEKAIVYGGH